MNHIIDKFASLEAEIARKKGDFTLYALFLRGVLPDRWDLIVSAPWTTQDQKHEVVDYFVSEIKSHLGPDYLIYLSRIVVVDPSQPPLQELTKEFHVEHGKVEIRDGIFFGVPIRQAFIITSKSPEIPVAS